MNDSRKIRVDILHAAIQGVSLGALKALMTGRISDAEATAVASTLMTFSENIERLVEESVLMDLEDNNSEVR